MTGHVSFIDIGFNKTSIISYLNDTIISLNTLPIGGNHITKDISKILEIDLESSEQIKMNFDQGNKVLNDENLSLEMLQSIIFARTEEILELCNKSIDSNPLMLTYFKMVLMGEGSKILGNNYNDKILLSNDIDFLEETTEDICQSGFKLNLRLNKQEVLIIPKKQRKQGFFEKLFHSFK